MIKCISNANLVDNTEWEALIERHSNGNIFQTPMFYNAINSTNIHQCISAFAIQDNKLKGVIIAILQKEHKGLLGIFSMRSIVVGGPIVEDDDNDITRSLLIFFSNLTGKEAIYTQFRNLYETTSYLDVFRSIDFKFEDHLNIIVNLEKDSDSLWSKVHPKRRNEISRSRREGVTFEEVDNVAAIEKTYKILNEIYKKVKLPLPEIEYFLKAYQILGSKIFKIFVAKFDNKIVGTMYTLCYKHTIYDWYAGSYPAYYNKYPNDLITWEVFMWGKISGYKYFDFGGAGKPGVPYGVRNYKMKFGGTIVNYGRYEKINKPFLMAIAQFGFRLWQLIRK